MCVFYFRFQDVVKGVKYKQGSKDKFTAKPMVIDFLNKYSKDYASTMSNSDGDDGDDGDVSDASNSDDLEIVPQLFPSALMAGLCDQFRGATGDPCWDTASAQWPPSEPLKWPREWRQRNKRVLSSL